ncbi:MAG: hypothetical protein APR53_08975 [Methanoculleus sp. SDB]|nr:MAG: hypothetical protein APR53_08975 [Methanoculleus sp. SDB]
MFLKVHHAPGAGDVVAVCDAGLLNRTLKHGEIEVCVSEKFYGSAAADEEEVRRALTGASNINLMGERCVAIAVDLGLIEAGSGIMIGNVPHVQIVRI